MDALATVVFIFSYVIEKQKVNGKKGKQRPEREIKLIHFATYLPPHLLTFMALYGALQIC